MHTNGRYWTVAEIMASSELQAEVIERGVICAHAMREIDDPAAFMAAVRELRHARRNCNIGLGTAADKIAALLPPETADG